LVSSILNFYYTAKFSKKSLDKAEKIDKAEKNSLICTSKFKEK